MSEQDNTEQQGSWTASSIPNLRTWLLALGALALVVLAAGSFGNGATSARESFNPAGIDEVVLNVRSAGVTISEGTSPDIQVLTNGQGSTSQQLSVRERGNRLEVELTRRPWSFSLWSFRSNQLTVLLPQGFSPDLTVTAVSGGVELTGVSLDDLVMTVRSGRASLRNLRVGGDAEVETRSGQLNIRASRIAGNLRAVTRSGGLNLADTEAATYTLDASSGSIAATGLTGAAVDATVRSGRMSLAAATMLADWNLSARSGGVTVSLDREPRAWQVQFDGRSGSWNIADRYGLDVNSSGRNQMQARSGSGGPTLQVETRSGGFRLD